MKASVVIRTKNEARFVGKTLEAVAAQRFDGDYEVIIVDSGSTDATLDIIGKYDVALVKIPEKDFTYGRALNLGAERAAGDFIVNLSAHALPFDERWLSGLMAGFSDGSVAGVYGRQLSVEKVNPFEARKNEIFFGNESLRFSSTKKQELRKIHFSNANSAVRKSVWSRYQFNEKAPYAEDFLWQKEVLAAGFSIVYAPTAVVYHTHEVDIAGAYRCSKKCAFAMATAKKSMPCVPHIALDFGVLLAFLPYSVLQHVWYLWEKKHYRYLIRTPLYVAATWLGWLQGRIQFRLRG